MLGCSELDDGLGLTTTAVVPAFELQPPAVMVTE
jgi:hypothetical protein